MAALKFFALGFKKAHKNKLSFKAAKVGENGFGDYKHVEIDETFVGGRQPANIGRARKEKTVVLGLKQRGGGLVTEFVNDYKRSSLKPVILETVEELLYQERMKDSVRLLGISLNNLNTEEKKAVIVQLKFAF